MGGGGGSAPPAPDYSGLINAAQTQAARYNNLVDEQLKFAKDAYQHQLPYTDKIQALNLRTAQDASDFAKGQQAQYEKLYRPLQAKFVDEAQNYASPDKKALARGQAMAAVGQQFDAAGDAAKRNLESYGIDPSATRFAALDVGTRTAKAAATAAAGTQSDVNRELTGLGLEAQALNIGNGLPGQVTQSQNTSTMAGSAGNTAGNSTYGTYSGALGNPQSFGALGNQSLGLAGSLTGQQYQGQLAAFNANQNSSSGFGSMLGAGIGAAAQIAPLSLAEGGAVPVAGQTVPTALSPSGGAQTDDVPATVDGSSQPQAAINAGEFVFPKDVANWLGEEKLQKMIVKARQDKANAGAQPEQKPTAALPVGGAPHMANGGPVPPVSAVPAGPRFSRSQMPVHAPMPRPSRPVSAAPGAGGGAGHISALPVGRVHRPAPYPGGSNAGAVRSAIPGV